MPASGDTNKSRARVAFAAAGLAYLFWCLFLGGFPLRGQVPAALLSGKTAVGVFVLAVLFYHGALQDAARPRWKEGIVLLAILLAGGLLRFRGIGASAAWGPTIDEPILMNPVLQMMRTGKLDPMAYEYGAVCFYLLLAVNVLTAVRLTSSFQYQNPGMIPDQMYYVAGRQSMALVSLGTVAGAYFTARRFFGKPAAVVAAAVLAFSSLSYMTAHQIRLDVPLALFVLVAHYFLLRMLEENSALNYMLAGIFCGLSIGTKYTVLPLIGSLLLAHGMAEGRKRWLDWNILLGLVSTAGTFVLFNFFAFAHLDRFLERLPRAVYHNLSPEHWSASDNRPLQYFTDLIGQGVGIVALVLAVLALVHAIRTRDRRLLLLWCFPVLLLALMGSYPSGFPRYLLPVIPVLSILAGAGAGILAQWTALRFPRFSAKAGRIEVAALLVAIALPAAGSVAYWMESGRVLKAETITTWVSANIPESARIVMDPTGPILPGERYRITTLTYRDFQNPKNLRDAEFVCVSEDLFRRVPAGFRLLQEFPARTRSLDRTFRIYSR